MAAPSTPSLAYKLETLAIDMLREHESLVGVAINHYAEDTRAEINRIVCKATLGEQEQGGVRPWNVTLEVQAYVTERDAGLIEDYSRAIDETFTDFPAVTYLRAFDYLTYLGEEEEDADNARETRQRVKTYNFHAQESTSEEALRWAMTVTAIGGTYTEGQYAALAAFVSGCKADGVWDLLEEVYPFAGENLIAARVKLKRHTSGVDTLTAYNFTGSEYVANIGINLPSNSNKHLDGIPTLGAMGLNGTDYSFGIVKQSITPTSGQGYLLSESPSSGQPAFYAAHHFIGINGTAGDQAPSRACTAFTMANFSAGGYHGRRHAHTVTTRAATTFAVGGSNPIDLFRARRNGSYFYVNGRLSFAFFGSSMTEDQSAKFAVRVNALQTALGREVAPAPRSLFLGDSITAGFGSTTSRYSMLCAASDGHSELNLGVPGGCLTEDADPEVAGIEIALTVLAYAPSKIYLMYGVNDSRSTGNPARAVQFEADLKATVGAFISSGFPASSIVIGSVPYTNDTPTATQNAYVAAALSAAQLHHTKYADVNAAMIAGGGASLLSDGVHPNESGHSVIADALQGATIQ